MIHRSTNYVLDKTSKIESEFHLDSVYGTIGELSTVLLKANPPSSANDSKPKEEIRKKNTWYLQTFLHEFKVNCDSITAIHMWTITMVRNYF